jgi:hypothetical protein
MREYGGTVPWNRAHFDSGYVLATRVEIENRPPRRVRYDVRSLPHSSVGADPLLNNNTRREGRGGGREGRGSSYCIHTRAVAHAV